MFASRRKGLAVPPEELSARVRAAIRELGVDETARSLQLSRETCLSLGAEAIVTRGSIAIAERNIGDLDQSPAGPDATLEAR